MMILHVQKCSRCLDHFQITPLRCLNTYFKRKSSGLKNPSLLAKEPLKTLSMRERRRKQYFCCFGVFNTEEGTCIYRQKPLYRLKRVSLLNEVNLVSWL